VCRAPATDYPARHVIRLRLEIVLAAAAAAASGAAGRAQQRSFTETVTERGMRIWSFPDDDADRVSFAVLVGVGSRDEAPGQAGIAHFLEHVVLARTALRPKAAADPDLTALGINWNGVTSHESTCFYLSCAPEHWQFAVEWLADHVVRPAIAAEDVDAERRIVRQEIETRQPHAGEVTFEGQLYPDHALGRSVGGDRSQLEAVDRTALERFHALHYRAGNVAVGFSGRVPREDCVAAIRSAFADLPEGKGAEVQDPVRPRAGDFSRGRDIGQAKARMTVGYHLPATSPRELGLARLLAGYLNARFFREVRELRQLAYAPEVDVIEHRDTCRLDFRVDVGDRADLPQVIGIVDALAQELQQPDADRLAAARASLSGLLQASDGPQLADVMELAWLVRRLGVSPGELAAAIGALTARDVAEFAQLYLTSGRRFLVADVSIPRQFTAWAALAVLAVLLLLLDAFQSFQRTRQLFAYAAATGRGWLSRRRAPRGEIKQFQKPERPIVPVPGDEIEKSIQRYFEEEERRES